VGWLIVASLLLAGASALLSDLCLHHTAATSARIQAILRRAEEAPCPAPMRSWWTPRSGADPGR
jgi:hypothetical protein